MPKSKPIDKAIALEVLRLRECGCNVDQIRVKCGISKNQIYKIVHAAKDKVEARVLDKSFVTRTGNVIMPEGSGGRFELMLFTRAQKFVGTVEMALYPSYWGMMEAASLYGFNCVDCKDTAQDGRTISGVLYASRGNDVPCGYYELSYTGAAPTLAEKLR